VGTSRDDEDDRIDAMPNERRRVSRAPQRGALDGGRLYVRAERVRRDRAGRGWQAAAAACPSRHLDAIDNLIRAGLAAPEFALGCGMLPSDVKASRHR
jgi:hypothetical protein